MKRCTQKLFSAVIALTLLYSLAVPAFAAATTDTNGRIVLKAGSAQVMKENTMAELDAPVFLQQASKRNGVDANAADSAHPAFFATHMDTVDIFYAPLSLFEAVYGAEVTYYGQGRQAVITFPEGMSVKEVAVGTPDPEDAALVYASDAAMAIVDGAIVRMTDNALFANNTIYVPMVSFAQDVLGLYACAEGEVLCVSKALVTDLAEESAALAARFTAAPEGMTAPDPVPVTENLPVLPATITSAGTYMTSRGDVEDLFGDGRDHEWNVYVPACYDAASEEKVPLLILLHGNSSRSQKYAPRSFYRYLAELHNIILVFPTSTDAGIDESGQSRGQPWNEIFRKADDVNQDVIFLNAMLDYMLENYRVDEGKLFMGGHSNGDLMANRFAASKYGSRLAGCYGSGGAVHYSSAWTGNPLVDGVEGAPVHNVPIYQTRGANDLSALTVNEFGDRNPHIIDPVAEGQKMASSNEYAKQMWLKQNETDQVPEIRVEGINNYEIYRGDKGDVLYHSIIGEPHAEVINATQNAWDNLISRYTRNPDGTLTDAGVAMKGDEKAVALLVGASNAYVGCAVTALSAEVIRENGLIYAPVDALVKGFGAEAAGSVLTVAGKSVRLSAGKSTVTVDGASVALAGKVLSRQGTLYVPAASFAQEVLGLYASEKINALYICDHDAILSYSTYYTLYRILAPEDFDSFHAMSNMMGIPTAAKVGEEIDLAAGAVIFPANATKTLADVVWSVYDAGTTGAVITGSKLTTTAPGTVRVTAMVESGTGTGSADISSRFLQNFDIVIKEPFSDVNASQWFYEDVKYVCQAGLMQGTGAETFSPYVETSRGMIVTILYRLAGSPAVTGACDFADVADGSYCEDAVIWAAANGITTGYDNGLFGAADFITREQLAVFLYRYAAYQGMNAVTLAERLSTFPDSDQVTAYAVPAMQWAVAQGLISGKDGGILDPQGTATRAEAAAILHRFCK